MQKERGVSCDPETPTGFFPRDPKRPGLNARLGIMAFGHQCTLPRLRHQCSPSGTYASGRQSIPFREILASSPQSTSRRPRRPGPDPCPPHLRKAPPRGRGSGPLPQRPLQLLRCPRMRQSCTARRVPSDGRGGSARELLGPASFLSPPPTRGQWGRQYACAVAASGGCCGGEEMEGGVSAQGRQVGEQAPSYG